MTGSEKADATSSDVFIAENHQFLGTVQIADKLRPEAVDAVAELSRMGLRTTLLTGDHRSIGHRVAKELAVHDVEAELLPEEKMDRIRKLMVARPYGHHDR